MQKTPMASTMGDSAFGVQSLEDTIGSTVSREDSLSRTNSNMSDASVEAGADATGVVAGRKRKAGNPVHPKILATGQRILSAEHTSGSPVSLRSTDSPHRNASRRRASVSSSINLSQPLTPLKMSPQPASAMPSTPRSGSPKSFRLSDEEASISSDTNSQAIQSSSGEEDDGAGLESADKPDAMPQLVMPSIAMPTRRPFTEKGKRMGRLKIMVVGARNVGKTSLIQSICRACEDVVHLDSLGGDIRPPNEMNEIGASTRPYPSWWTDFETRRQLLRRKSIGDGVLERNITFVDTPGFDCGRNVQQVLKHFKSSLSRIGNMASMHDSDLVATLSGEGGLQIDAVLYLFDSAVSSEESPEHLQMDYEQSLLFQYLCKWTNVIPLVGRADAVETEELLKRKKQILQMFNEFQAEPCIDRGVLDDVESDTMAKNPEAPLEPYAISSAVGDDPETIDASVLMSSSYLQPLTPSELDIFVGRLLEPDNMARLRHLSATKFLLWRQEHLFSHIDLNKQLSLKPPRFEPRSPDVASTGSIPEDPSKVLVPHGTSNYFRSTSPSASSSSANDGNELDPSAYALSRHTDNASPSEPFRQVRLAKWAQDLQRSLDNERRRYQQIYAANVPSGWTSNNSADSASDKPSSPTNNALIHKSPSRTDPSRPPKGRLGGDLGIIDPRDPLGVLAFGQTFRRGCSVLQIAGGFGLAGAVVWWVCRNWAELQEFLGLGMGGADDVEGLLLSRRPNRGWVDEARGVVWAWGLGWCFDAMGGME